MTNRIVGTLVVVALLALIVPELLKEPEAPTPEKYEVIPLRPELGDTPKPATYPSDALATNATVPKATPLPDNDAAKTPATSSSASPAASAKVTPPPAKTSTAAKPAVAGDAWVIQMGAFGNHQSAQALVKQLRSSGYKAFLVQEGGLSKVLVGPDTDKSRLAAQIDKLNHISGLKGRVFQYDPLQ
ncbi:SPOR domain-containing protein [Gallaecimonas mangrovi]|uniref:SPOR domain-containing protein n=1 Tax=Gallaecimonas mangrovi TaxID=2291597 RepID=UPI0012601737|nr:SPOR domain-containing protein [Gallaecimonas mangrovi]